MEGESPLLKDGALSLQTSLSHRELPPCPRRFRSEDLFRFWRVAGAWGKFLCLGRYEFVAECGCRTPLASGVHSDNKSYTRAERFPSVNRVRSRTFQSKPPPARNKNFPQEHPPKAKRKKFSPCKGGCSWGKFSGGQGGLEGRTPSPKEGVLRLQGLSLTSSRQRFPCGA